MNLRCLHSRGCTGGWVVGRQAGWLVAIPKAELYGSSTLGRKLVRHGSSASDCKGWWRKQTMVNLVAAGLGCALVPKWISRLSIQGVRYIPLSGVAAGDLKLLPLAVAWVRGSRDPAPEPMLKILDEPHLTYQSHARTSGADADGKFGSCRHCEFDAHHASPEVARLQSSKAGYEHA